MFLFFTLAKGIYMHKENNTYYIYSCITQRIPSKCQVEFAGWIEKKFLKILNIFHIVHCTYVTEIQSTIAL